MASLFIFGLSIAIFLFLLTLVKRDKSRADHLLSYWMGFITLHLVLFLLDYSGVFFNYPHLLGILLPLPILHGVFLYFFTLEITTNRLPSATKSLLHFLPFLLLVGLAIPFYSLSGEEKIDVFVNKGKGYEWYGIVQTVLFAVSGFGYSIASVFEIRKHRKHILQLFSNHEKKKLEWLEWMSYGLGGIWLLSIFFGDDVVFSGVVLFILFIGIFGITQTPVFLTQENRADNSTIDPAPDEAVGGKYHRSGLDEAEARRLAVLLENFMQSQKPYKDPNLTLDQLSAAIHADPNHLSQVINSRLGKTFYHYINSYRIKEFLLLAALPESSRFTYLGLAYDCGFQSKTTFNKYFKLETGKNPSQHFQAVRAS